ncbi:MAG: hypothetical protein J6A83_01180 [Clostridia bacterium]|nr:hypothetical protein [Clostridia bacterium]
MKGYTIRLVALTVLAALLITCAGCRVNNTSDGEAELTKASSTEEKCDCIIAGKKIYFVDDSQKREWRAPLAKLLSNVLVPYGENGEIGGYEASVDPKAPTIPQSYACGLLDITMDGVPELLVHPFGYHGSSGTVTYFVYNIYSGQCLGEIDSGRDELWSFYYYSESDELRLVGQYWLRYGWPSRDRFIDTVGYDEGYNECYSMSYFKTSHEIYGEQTDIVDEDPDDMFYSATWVESYPDTTYYLHNREVYLDDYYAEYNSFVRNCIPISETALTVIWWGDVSEDEDDYATKGRKMADALLASEQEFIDFSK